MGLILPQLDQLTTSVGRCYRTPQGNIYPSVTTVLGANDNDWLEEWKKNVGEEKANQISSRASRRGTRIHKLMEDHFTTGDVQCASIFDEVTYKSLLPVLAKINNIIVQEGRLYSDFLRSAGTVDLVANYDGKISVVDWKTSRRPKYKSEISHYFMQSSAYAYMMWELFQIPIRQVVIVIAVDDDLPQVYVERVDNWLQEYRIVRNAFTYNEQELIITA